MFAYVVSWDIFVGVIFSEQYKQLFSRNFKRAEPTRLVYILKTLAISAP